MKLNDLVADERTSLTRGAIDLKSYNATIRHLTSYAFWQGEPEQPSLWEHQQAAIATVVGYLSGDKAIPERPEHKEAALLKLPTGTGKSGIIAVVARCLPKIRRVLILTPRTALTEQLLKDVRYRFWKHIGFEHEGTALFTAEADDVGADIESVYVQQLLPSKMDAINYHLEEPTSDRTVLVGTHQALSDIRNIASDRDDGRCLGAAALIRKIKDDFDLVIVDEGHYEPAISWSQGVREFNLPTILLSATPYRNDYKSFRVRGRYLFNFPYHRAVDEGIIRPANIIVPEAGGEPPAEEAGIDGFVEMLHEELEERIQQAVSWLSADQHPKIMVRGDDLNTLRLLQAAINHTFDTRAVVIHDRATKTAENQDLFTSVAGALRSRPDAQFWIHQNKLMEGIDDPSFVAVAIYDLMGNARQLVQQIGRVTRQSKGEIGANQVGWVLASPANARRIEETWERYKGYEQYAARNTAHIVTNEVTLPDRLLEYMAEYQYISGEFRRRFEFEKPLASSDIQLPRTAAVLRVHEPDFDIRRLISVVEDFIMDKDRFKVTPIEGMPDGTIGFSYYAWRNSPFLIDRFFSEWKLGIFIAVHQDGFVFMHDTEGLVVDTDRLNLSRAERSIMEKAFPETEDGRSRLSRMSFSSLDMSQNSIRSMALRTRSFADAFTDLLDPSLVPATAAGFVGGSARYVGFTRSRLRDASERYVPISKYIEWTEETASGFTDEASKRSSVFGRYADIVEGITKDEALPVSILLDPSLDEFGDDEAAGAAWVLQPDLDYFDLSADVDPDTGEFTILIGDKEVACQVEYRPKTRKYSVSSLELDQLAPPPEVEDRRQAPTLTQRLNKTQAFRILIEREGVVYSEGNFFRPKIKWVQDGNSKPVVEYIHAAACLDAVESEKGENFYDDDLHEWQRKSIFGIFAATCNDQRSAAGIEEDSLTTAIESFPVWLCDDDSREVSDFIGLDPVSKRIVLVHAKVGSQGSGGWGFNVGGLQEVGRQALASLGFISRGQISPIWTPERWTTDVQANTTTLNGRNRIFRSPDGLSAAELNDLLRTSCTNPSFNREIWIVGAKMTRREVLVDGLDNEPLGNRLRQFLMHWDAMQTACARANTRLKFYCSK
ncbi:MAG: hypothetical protein APF78_01170 [Sphingomonadales bacterium BRH_c3]|nr:MAG: hypothetical protein APF78_01170 [Sphingomonadales bacterium BRH_c3]